MKRVCDCRKRRLQGGWAWVQQQGTLQRHLGRVATPLRIGALTACTSSRKDCIPAEHPSGCAWSLAGRAAHLLGITACLSGLLASRTTHAACRSGWLGCCCRICCPQPLRRCLAACGALCLLGRLEVPNCRQARGIVLPLSWST